MVALAAACLAAAAAPSWARNVPSAPMVLINGDEKITVEPWCRPDRADPGLNGSRWA